MLKKWKLLLLNRTSFVTKLDRYKVYKDLFKRRINMEKRIGIFISGPTNPNISKEYNQAAVELGKMIDIKI